MKKQAKTKKLEKPTSFSEALGLNHILGNEKMNFILGLVLLAIAIYLLLAFVSFFATGEADQSLIESPRPEDLANMKREFQNSCGSLGAYTAYFFI